MKVLLKKATDNIYWYILHRKYDVLIENNEIIMKKLYNKMWIVMKIDDYNDTILYDAYYKRNNLS